jgi:heme exporter protein D
MSDFLYMGGYATYVWLSYAVALVVLVSNLLLSARQRKQLLRGIARRLKREAKLQ